MNEDTPPKRKRGGRKAPVSQGVRRSAGAQELVRELNHRVKNNFQIIVSLMNLKKRTLPSDRHAELRFVEEHVHSMSVAYRLVYATGAMNKVSVTELITEVVAGLRQIAGLNEDRVKIQSSTIDTMISLDHGIALALYLAVLLPPYFDEAMVSPAAITSMTIGVRADEVTLSVRWSGHPGVLLDALRGRLMKAYASQIQALTLPTTNGEVKRICFHTSGLLD